MTNATHDCKASNCYPYNGLILSLSITSVAFATFSMLVFYGVFGK